MDSIKEGRILSIITETLSKFVSEESTNESFITVTYVVLNNSGRTASVYCSIFPKEMEEKAFRFLKKREGHARDILREKTSLRNIPHVRFLKTKETDFLNKTNR